MRSVALWPAARNAIKLGGRCRNREPFPKRSCLTAPCKPWAALSRPHPSRFPQLLGPFPENAASLFPARTPATSADMSSYGEQESWTDEQDETKESNMKPLVSPDVPLSLSNRHHPCQCHVRVSS